MTGESERSCTTCGVPQGSVLGLKLFLLYIKNACHICKVYTFAAVYFFLRLKSQQNPTLSSKLQPQDKNNHDIRLFLHKLPECVAVKTEQITGLALGCESMAGVRYGFVMVFVVFDKRKSSEVSGSDKGASAARARRRVWKKLNTRRREQGGNHRDPEHG